MSNFIKEWGEKIDWNKRVKSVCKPCWEIKYCPYGVLVEEFPLKKENDDRSCRIYGHDCPVFYVAEPLTETRELRNINRAISRTTQFKVLKRDNQICYECGKSVREDEIDFDHIIPWSKGGSSDEYNIRTLCSTCNKKKGNDFEFNHLIVDGTDIIIEQHEQDLFHFFEALVMMGQMFYNNNGFLPTAQDIADEYSEGKISSFESSANEIISDLEIYFNQNTTIDIPKSHHNALRKRWGFDKKKNKYPQRMLSLSEISKINKLSIDKLLMNEIKILEKLGFRVKRDKSVLEKWKRL